MTYSINPPSINPPNPSKPRTQKSQEPQLWLILGDLADHWANQPTDSPYPPKAPGTLATGDGRTASVEMTMEMKITSWIYVECISMVI